MDMKRTTEFAPEADKLLKFQPEHYERVLKIRNTLFPDHAMSLKELRFEDESWDHDRYTFERYVALDIAGDVVGFIEYGHSPSIFHPRKFWMEINVDPERQRRGIGTLLYDFLMGRLEELKAVEVRSWAQESMGESVRFLQHRSFVEQQRTWESVLDLSWFEPSQYRGQLRSMEGVEIVTRAQEIEVRSELNSMLHELAATLMKDVPLPGKYTPVSLELFRQWTLESPGALSEGYFLATKGGEYVGQCVLQRQLGMEGSLEHGLTGVRREFRRHGLAMALKVRALEWAKEAGYRTVRTWNDSANRGMLAINERLGFVREPAWISFVKKLRVKDER